VTPRPELRDDLAVDILVGAEMGEGGIAAKHRSGTGVQHAATGAAADVVFDLVQPLHRAPSSGPATSLAGLIAAVTINLRLGMSGLPAAEPPQAQVPSDAGREREA